MITPFRAKFHAKQLKALLASGRKLPTGAVVQWGPMMNIIARNHQNNLIAQGIRP